jgi:hypothetical protein
VVGDVAWGLMMAAIPGAIGMLLFRRQGDQSNLALEKSRFR